MKFTEHLVVKLLNIEYEKFTQFCITAVSIAKAEPHFDIDDLKRIEWLISNVNINLQTSIYKLDRFVDPTKFSDNPTKWSYPIKFKSDKIMDNTGDDKKEISIRAEDLQKQLCEVVQEINGIMYQNLSAYNEDFVMPKNDDENKIEGFN